MQEKKLFLTRSLSSTVIIVSEFDATATWTRDSGLLRETLLDAMVTLTLVETDTVMLLELPSMRVLQDTAEFRMVRLFFPSSNPKQ